MEKKKIVAIIQAHMGSSRLPGKIMRDLCGMPALYRMIERVRLCENVDQIVVATSRMACDDAVVEACRQWGIPTFRGSDHDVLARYWGATQAYPAEGYVRLTSDCPAIDPWGLDELIRFFREHTYRFVSVEMETHLDGCWSYEIFTAELMDETYEKAEEGYEREHVTPYMYTKQPSWCRVPCRFDGSKYRVTLDTPEDYALIKSVFEALYQPDRPFTIEQVVAYLDAHPEVCRINADVAAIPFTQCSYESFDDEE